MVKIEENTDIDVSSFNSTSVRLNALCEIHLSTEDACFNSTSVRLNDFVVHILVLFQVVSILHQYD